MIPEINDPMACRDHASAAAWWESFRHCTIHPKEAELMTAEEMNWIKTVFYSGMVAAILAARHIARIESPEGGAFVLSMLNQELDEFFRRGA